MKFFKERAEKRKQEFMEHVRPEIIELVERKKPITLSQYKKLRINSYEQRYLFPLLDNETLLWVTEYALHQEGSERMRRHSLPKSYLDSILRLFIHEIIKRFSDIIAENKRLSKHPQECIGGGECFKDKYCQCVSCDNQWWYDEDL